MWSKRSAFLLLGLFLVTLVNAQRGAIIKSGSSVLDPNGDGYVSKTTAGFSNDGYYVDEFEIPMFGIPIVADGDVLNDNQAGPKCGTTDLTVDSKGFSAYGVLDNNKNLIFRFRVGDDQPSVEAYSILIDTDGKIGPDDPNATANNPGFELDITLIKNRNKGVYVYNLDGIESCPTPDLHYPYSTHFQIAVADIVSCGNPDYFYDFYVPLSALVSKYGISEDVTQLRFVAVTNVSATCSMSGKISDIGGVDDTVYGGCNSCAFLDLVNNQCPISLSNLCTSCQGFLSGVTPKPKINVPLKTGDTDVTGQAEAGAFVFFNIYDPSKVLTAQDTVTTDMSGNWVVPLAAPLVLGDSVTARAHTEGKCASGNTSLGTSFALVVQDQPPQLTLATTSISYTENAAAKTVAGAITVADPDDAMMESATVAFTANYVSSQDVLTYTLPPGTSGSFNSATGSLTVTGTATQAAYQAFFASITYRNSSENPSALTRTLALQVNDGALNSNIISIQISVIPVNDPPVVTGTSSAVPYAGGTITLDNTLAVSDVDNAQLQGATITISQNFASGEDAFAFTNQNGITGSFNPATGVLTLSGAATLANYSTALASITFSSSSSSPLTRKVTVIANDGTDNSAPFNIFIDFPGVNNPPVITDGGGNPVDSVFYSILEDTKLDTCVNAVDPDGDPVEITSITPITGNGSFTMTGGLCFSYTPDPDYNGQDRATVTVCDQVAGSLCDAAVIVVNVIPVNDPPVIVVTPVTVDENSTTQICISVTDKENDPAVFHDGTSDEGTIIDPDTGDLCFDFTPTTGFTGDTGIIVEVCDLNDPGVCTSDTIPVTVVPLPNNPPIILVNGVPGDTLRATTPEDTPLIVCFESVDPDGNDVSLNSVQNTSGGGTLTIYNNIEFCFTFTPVLNFNGNSIWHVTVCDDGVPSLCGSVVIIIDVTPVNDPPTAVTDTLTVTRFVAGGGNLLTNDSDIDNDPLSMETTPVSGPYHGQAILHPDGSVDYTSVRTYRGIDSLRYTVCDNGTPQGCSVGKVVINIQDLPLKVYQGVTPNGDGNNDFLRIDGIDFYTDNVVKIFDRYDNLVFETKGYNNEDVVWRGDSNRGLGRKELPEGTYYYLVYPGAGVKPLSGFVVLKRN